MVVLPVFWLIYAKFLVNKNLTSYVYCGKIIVDFNNPKATMKGGFSWTKK